MSGGAAKPEPGSAMEDDKNAIDDGFQEASGNDPFVFTISDRKVSLSTLPPFAARQLEIRAAGVQREQIACDAVAWRAHEPCSLQLSMICMSSALVFPDHAMPEAQPLVSVTILAQHAHPRHLHVMLHCGRLATAQQGPQGRSCT